MQLLGKIITVSSLVLVSLLTLQLFSRFNELTIDEYLQNADFNGAVIITHHGKTLLKKGYGYANHEFEIPNNHTTKFPIASNTKLITAIAVMILQEKNILNVHNSLSNYIADFPHADNITLHHLLTHTSGIANYYKHWSDIADCKDVQSMVDAVKKWDLEFEPGTQYSYSNTGYLLLAYIIEKVSGLSFESFLEENLFKPLHMKNSGSISVERIIKNKASGYRVNDNFLCNAPLIHNPLTLLGSGDVFSSIEDMGIVLHALLSGKIINETSLQTMFAHHVAMEGSTERFHGYGCFIDKKDGRSVIGYSGHILGFLSKIMIFIDENITMVILTNKEDLDQMDKIFDDLPRLFFNANSM